MLYRIATKEDEVTLGKLLYHSISVPSGETRPGPEVLPEMARYARSWGRLAGDRGVLAEDKGEVVGGAWLRQWTTADHGYGYVDVATPELSIAVVPERRGENIGTGLLGRLLAEAAKEHRAVSLSVAEYNRALQLYERFGFKPVRRDGDSITMLLSFEPASPDQNLGEKSAQRPAIHQRGVNGRRFSKGTFHRKMAATSRLRKGPDASARTLTSPSSGAMACWAVRTFIDPEQR